MIIYVDLDIVLEQFDKLNWQHDVGIQLIYVHVRLVLNPGDNGLMHDIYKKKKRKMNENKDQ